MSDCVVGLGGVATSSFFNNLVCPAAPNNATARKEIFPKLSSTRTVGPVLLGGLAIASAAAIDVGGFTYKTCAFDWTKADTSQIDLFRDDADAAIGTGYWTRANTESCLLATRGRRRRVHADIGQANIESRREHSRKPDGIHGRIERLVAGPHREVFARR
jgi:hypothetical protein